MHSLPRQEPGFLLSQLPTPVGSACTHREISTIMTLFCVQSNYLSSIYTTATSVLTQEAQLRANWSQPVKAPAVAT